MDDLLRASATPATSSVQLQSPDPSTARQDPSSAAARALASAQANSDAVTVPAGCRATGTQDQSLAADVLTASAVATGALQLHGSPAPAADAAGASFSSPAAAQAGPLTGGVPTSAPAAAPAGAEAVVRSPSPSVTSGEPAQQWVPLLDHMVQLLMQQGGAPSPEAALEALAVDQLVWYHNIYCFLNAALRHTKVGWWSVSAGHHGAWLQPVPQCGA